LLVVLMAASYAPLATPKTDGKTMTITILSRIRILQPHDTAPKGKENKGDWIKYQSLLLTVGPLFGRKKANTPVGYEKGTQTFVNATDARVSGTSTFPGQGTISYRGAMKSLKNGRVSVPIVNGTGKFSGAKGVLVIGPGQTESVNTYRLKLPDVGVA
jgi:hypothetical protein